MSDKGHGDRGRVVRKEPRRVEKLITSSRRETEVQRKETKMSRSVGDRRRRRIWRRLAFESADGEFWLAYMSTVLSGVSLLM